MEEQQQTKLLPSGGSKPDFFDVLVVDGFQRRRETYRIKGTRARMFYAGSLKELEEWLERDYWDVVMLSSYIEVAKWDPLAPIPLLTAAHKEGKVRGVILISPVTGDARSQFAELKAAGVPVAYYPHTIDGQHNRVWLHD